MLEVLVSDASVSAALLYRKTLKHPKKQVGITAFSMMAKNPIKII